VSRAAGVAALGTTMCLLAAAFGVPALYVPAVALVLLALASSTTVALAGRLVRVAREPAAASVEEGDALRLTVRLDGRRPPLAGGELRTWPGAEPLPLRRSARAALALDIRPARRGAHEIGPASVRFHDPFGLCVQTRRSGPCEVLVLPRVERLEGERLSQLAGLQGDAQGRTRRWADGSDIDGLRPYRAGASASRIHWPAVARSGTLIEKRPASSGEGQALLVLDARSPGDEQALDKVIRAAASLCVALARLGGCSLLLPGATRAEPLDRSLARWPELHHRLALVREGSGPIRDLVRGALVIWVAAAPANPSDCDYSVAAAPRDDRPVLLSVAGCALQPATRAGTGVDASRGAGGGAAAAVA
jgi:uncharacterized protein (DUF58 family)